MKKTVVIYKSKYGSTKKYAEFIAKEIGADLLEEEAVKVERLKKYTNIILGGGLYAGGISGANLLRKEFENIKDKNIIVFTVGLASTKDPSIFKPSIDKNFTNEMQDKIKFFHLRGGIDYKRLSLLHKGMMWMVTRMLKKKKEEELTSDDRGMLDSYGSKVDFVDYNTTKELIHYFRKNKW